MKERMKAIPYGISDFKQLRRDGLYYVDKTMFLPKMEEAGHFLFLIRPRRFGKSIFLSMMRAYYDTNERDHFDSLFDATWIQQNPTPIRNTFEVLYLDFSQVGGRIEHLYENFDRYIYMRVNAFAESYAHLYPEGYIEKLNEYKDGLNRLNYIHDRGKELGHRLYLIVDEYDNFTNTVLNEQGEEVYNALTHASGFYRDVFKKFKGNYDRILMMGVSPVTMDDVTSGYNIALNITTSPSFNQMLGFSEEDVRTMIRYYRNYGVLDQDEDTLVGEMRPWYDNYCFSKSVVDTDPKMFNSDMVCYYLKQMIQNGSAPEEMLDVNTRTDYAKLSKLLSLDRLDGNRRGILNEIADKGFIYSNPKNSFPAREMMDAENFVSLLFYYGMLTFGGVRGAKAKLVIPNNNVRLQYYDYLLKQYQEIASIDTDNLSNAYDMAALDGDWMPMVNQIAEAYEKTTSVRQLIEGERNLQGFMHAYLSLNPYYLTAPELELNHGYCDFFLMPDLQRYPMVKHSYILELKYLKQDASTIFAERQWMEAVGQINGYANAPLVKRLVGQTHLHLLVLQIRGYKMERAEEVYQ